MSLFKAISFGLIVFVSAVDHPTITAAPQLYRRQDDPAFVGLVGDQCAYLLAWTFTFIFHCLDID